MAHQLKHQLQGFLLAATLLTALPLGRWLTADSQRAQGLALIYYPLIGALLGTLLWLSTLMLTNAPAPLAAVVVLLVWVLLTGALHLDGLADCLDAWYAGHACPDPGQRRECILTVMKDPTCGAMAVVGLVLVLLAKWVGLSHLLATGPMELALWCVLLAWPRAALLPWLLTSPYARTQGLATELKKQLRPLPVIVVTLVSATLGLWLLPVALAAGLLVALVVLTFVWRALWQRLLQGFTGDCLGALVELAELLLLFGLVWRLI